MPTPCLAKRPEKTRVWASVKALRVDFRSAASLRHFKYRKLAANSHTEILLERATELGQRLLPAFQTPSRHRNHTANQIEIQLWNMSQALAS